MINQALFYNLEIISLNDFTISIKAIYLLIALLLCFIFRKHRIIKLLLGVVYLVVLLGIMNVFVFNSGTNNPIIFDFSSRISYYFYNVIHYPINSINTYFMIYSHLYLIAFIFFYPIFQNHQFFIKFLVIINFFIIVTNLLDLANNSFDLYYLILIIIGYFMGYGISKIDIRKRT